MGCLTVKIERDGGINASVSVERHFNLDTERKGGIGVGLSRKAGISAKTEKVGKFFVQFGLICSAAYARQLKVSKDNLWLLPENAFQDSFAIVTEVEWHIT